MGGMRTSVSAVLIMLVSYPTSAAAASAGKNTTWTESGLAATPLIGATRVVASLGMVTSGYRSAAHNKRVGGVPTSHHLVGGAIDVARRPGVTHRMIDTALRRAGLVLIESLDERDHSHFAFAASLPSAAAGISQTVVPEAPAGKPPGRPVLADDHGILLAASPTLAIPGRHQRK